MGRLDERPTCPECGSPYPICQQCGCCYTCCDCEDKFLRCRDCGQPLLLDPTPHDAYGQIDYENGEYFYVKCHRCDLSWELVRIPDEYWEEARREASEKLRRAGQ